MEGTLLQRESETTTQDQPQRTESQPITLHFRNYDIFEANTVTLHFQHAENRDQTTSEHIHLKPGEYTTDMHAIDEPVASIRASLNSRNESTISIDPDTDQVVLLECGNGVIDINTTDTLPYHSHQSTAK